MIPGPGESKENFQKRQDQTEQALALLSKKYSDRRIEFVEGLPVYYGKKGLKLWEAGALWIYETKDKMRVPLIQIKKRNIDTFAHEKIHALRIAFEENRFEELLAYHTSSKQWRRSWGALLSRPRSIWAFLLLSMLTLFHPLLCALPIAYLFYRGMMLSKDRRILLNVIDKLGGFDYVLYLTDREILSFAKMTKKQIFSHLKTEQNSSFRIYKLRQLMSYKT